MRRILSLATLACLVLLLAAPALAAPQPERRVALVIGNGAYRQGPLKNPANDARDMAAALKSVGFEVILRENAGLRQMNEAIDQFWGSLKKGGVGLFFFAGHGLQVSGENYLVPVDAKIALEKDVQYECVNAGKVLGRMEDAGNGLNIVILDACRNNPFARSFRSDSRGLAKMDAPSGSLVAFATAPGDIAADGEGKNGLYTSHLLRHLRSPGLTIENVLKQTRIGVAADSAKMGKRQTPWESSSLMGDFYFRAGQQTAALVPLLPSGPSAQAASTAPPTVPPAPQPDRAGSLAGEYRLAGHSSTMTLLVRFKDEGAALTGTVQGSNGPFGFEGAVRDIQLKDGQLRFVVVQKGGLFPDIWYRFSCALSPDAADLPIVKTEKRFSATGAYSVSTEFRGAHLVREEVPAPTPAAAPQPAAQDALADRFAGRYAVAPGPGKTPGPLVLNFVIKDGQLAGTPSGGASSARPVSITDIRLQGKTLRFRYNYKLVVFGIASDRYTDFTGELGVDLSALPFTFDTHDGNVRDGWLVRVPE
ncbi:MAG: caspase domain-containing protein [Humidesulfovibrio sp.]